MKNSRMDAKRMALGAVLAALTVITLWIGNIIPVNRISLYALSSFYVGIIVIEYGIGWGWILYAVSALLSFIIVPDKIDIVPYVTFFGLFGVVKCYIERIGKAVVEYILKLLFFNANLAAAVFLASWLMGGTFYESIAEKLPLWLFILILQPVFIIYDYVYTMFIVYYRQKLRRLVQRH